VTDRILLIEDDKRLAEMVKNYLGEFGFSVTAAHSGSAGIALYRRESFDALILDLMLPDMDGLEVCRQIRADEQARILMLTARGDAMDRVVGLEMGADDYLAKPFEPRELLARLRSILRRAKGDSKPEVLRFGRVMSREALMDIVKNERLEAFDRSIDVHVSRIRAAIEDDPKHPRRIITVRGAGYVFAKSQD